MESQFQDVQKNIILRAKKQPEDVYVPVHCDVYSTVYDVVKKSLYLCTMYIIPNKYLSTFELNSYQNVPYFSLKNNCKYRILNSILKQCMQKKLHFSQPTKFCMHDSLSSLS